jgi:hypothetical protein
MSEFEVKLTASLLNRKYPGGVFYQMRSWQGAQLPLNMTYLSTSFVISDCTLNGSLPKKKKKKKLDKCKVSYEANIVRMIKLISLRWAGVVARMEQKGNACKAFVGRPDGNCRRVRRRSRSRILLS